MKPIVAIIAILGLVVAVAPAAAGFKEKFRIKGHNETDRLEERIEDRKQRASEARNDMTAARERVESLHKDLRKQDENYGKLVRQVGDLRSKLNNHEKSQRELNTKRNVALTVGKSVEKLDKAIGKETAAIKDARDRLQKTMEAVGEQKKNIDQKRAELVTSLEAMEGHRGNVREHRLGLHFEDWDYQVDQYGQSSFSDTSAGAQAPAPSARGAIPAESAADHVRALRKAFEDRLAEVRKTEQAHDKSVEAYDNAADAMRVLVRKRSEVLEPEVAEALKSYDTKRAAVERTRTRAENNAGILERAIASLEGGDAVHEKDRNKKIAELVGLRAAMQDLTRQIQDLDQAHATNLARLAQALKPGDARKLEDLSKSLKSLATKEQAQLAELAKAQDRARVADTALHLGRNDLARDYSTQEQSATYGALPNSAAVASTSSSAFRNN